MSKVPDWYEPGAEPAAVEALTPAQDAPVTRDGAAGQGHVYLLCFASTPYHHAKHYLGATGKPIADRLKAHRGERGPNGESLGRPARLVRAMLKAGGDFVLARSWSFPTTDLAFEAERALKRGGGGARHCPLCRPRAGLGKGWRKGQRVERASES
jgi:hypothetical protein